MGLATIMTPLTRNFPLASPLPPSPPSSPPLRTCSTSPISSPSTLPQHIHALLTNWSLPAHPSSLSSLLSPSIPIPALADSSSLSSPLFHALHDLSSLTIGQRSRAHSLLTTYFQARIREGSYAGGARGGIRAVLETGDVECAIGSVRRMSGGRKGSVVGGCAEGKRKFGGMSEEQGADGCGGAASDAQNADTEERMSVVKKVRRESKSKSKSKAVGLGIVTTPYPHSAVPAVLGGDDDTADVHTNPATNPDTDTSAAPSPTIDPLISPLISLPSLTPTTSLLPLSTLLSSDPIRPSIQKKTIQLPPINTSVVEIESASSFGSQGVEDLLGYVGAGGRDDNGDNDGGGGVGNAMGVGMGMGYQHSYGSVGVGSGSMSPAMMGYNTSTTDGSRAASFSNAQTQQQQQQQQQTYNPTHLPISQPHPQQQPYNPYNPPFAPPSLPSQPYQPQPLSHPLAPGASLGVNGLSVHPSMQVHPSVQAAQRATHEFNIRRLELADAEKWYTESRRRFVDAKRRMEGCVKRARGYR